MRMLFPMVRLAAMILALLGPVVSSTAQIAKVPFEQFKEAARNEPDKARQWAAEMLEAAESKFEGEPVRILQWYESLMSVFAANADAQSLLRFGRDAERIIQSAEARDDELLRLEQRICSMLGHAHSMVKDTKTREVYFKRCIEIARELYPESRFPNGHIDIAGALGNYAGVMSSSGQYAEAIRYFLQSNTMLEQLDPSDSDVNYYRACNHSDLGNLYLKQSRFIESRECLDQAYAFFKTQGGRRGIENRALCAGKLARWCRTMFNIAECEKFAHESLNAFKEFHKSAGGIHMDVADSYFSLAEILHAKGDYVSSNKMNQTSMEIRRKYLSKFGAKMSRGTMANHYNTMSYNSYRLGDARKALEYAEKTLEYDDQHYSYYMNLANAANKLGLTQKAVEALKTSIVLLKKKYPEQDYPLGHLNLGQHYVALGSAMESTPEAIAYLDRGIEILEGLFPGRDVGEKSIHPALLKARILRVMKQCEHPGGVAKVLREVEQIFDSWQGLVGRLLMTTNRDSCVRILEDLPSARDLYLAVAAHNNRSAAELYHVVWSSHGLMVDTSLAGNRVQLSEDLRTREYLQNLREMRAINSRPTLSSEEVETLELRAFDLRQKISRYESQEKQAVLTDYFKKRDMKWTELQASLADDVAVIHFVRFLNRLEWRREYCAFVLTQDSLQFVPLGLAETIDSQARTWLSSIRELNEDSTSGCAVYASVLQPILIHLPSHIRKLAIVPDGVTAEVPWSALPCSDSKRLVEDYDTAIVYDLRRCIGNSDKGGIPQRIETATAIEYGAPYERFTPVSETEDLVVRLREHVAPHQTIKNFVGQDATVDNLVDSLDQAEVFLVSSHGVFNRKKQEDYTDRVLQADTFRQLEFSSAIACAGANHDSHAFLSAAMIKGIDLGQMSLAIVNCCDLGSTEYIDRIGNVFGIASALNQAGCDRVISSLWGATVEHSHSVLDHFFDYHFAAAMDSNEALRAAQLKFLRDSYGKQKEPFFWANWMIAGTPTWLTDSGSDTRVKNRLEQLDSGKAAHLDVPVAELNPASGIPSRLILAIALAACASFFFYKAIFPLGIRSS